MADTSEGRITSPPSMIPGGYDATEGAGTDHAAPWEKLRGGTVDPATGQLTGEDFPSSGRWEQC